MIKKEIKVDVDYIKSQYQKGTQIIKVITGVSFDGSAGYTEKEVPVGNPIAYRIGKAIENNEKVFLIAGGDEIIQERIYFSPNGYIYGIKKDWEEETTTEIEEKDIISDIKIGLAEEAYIKYDNEGLSDWYDFFNNAVPKLKGTL